LLLAAAFLGFNAFFVGEVLFEVAAGTLQFGVGGAKLFPVALALAVKATRHLQLGARFAEHAVGQLARVVLEVRAQNAGRRRVIGRGCGRLALAAMARRALGADAFA
jgi:hypothetical protein